MPAGSIALATMALNIGCLTHPHTIYTMRIHEVSPLRSTTPATPATRCWTIVMSRTHQQAGDGTCVAWQLTGPRNCQEIHGKFMGKSWPTMRRYLKCVFYIALPHVWTIRLGMFEPSDCGFIWGDLHQQSGLEIAFAGLRCSMHAPSGSKSARRKPGCTRSTVQKSMKIAGKMHVHPPNNTVNVGFDTTSAFDGAESWHPDRSGLLGLLRPWQWIFLLPHTPNLSRENKILQLQLFLGCSFIPFIPYWSQWLGLKWP